MRALAPLLLVCLIPIVCSVHFHNSGATSTLSSLRQRSAASTHVSSFDTSSYHSSSSIINSLLSLRSSCSYLHLQYEKRHDSLTSQFSVKIDYTERSSRNVTKQRVLLYFGEHAREIITPETALKLVKYLCLTSDTPQHVKPAIQRVLTYNTIVLYPNVNRNVREQQIEARGLYCARTNPNGVDLNRNWDDHWNGERDMPDSNPGSSAFSEQETQILRDAAIVYKPEMFVSVHSGTLGMYSPFAYSADLPPPVNPDASSRPLYTALLEQHAARLQSRVHAYDHMGVDVDVDVDAGEFIHRTQQQRERDHKRTQHHHSTSSSSYDMVSTHDIHSLMSLTAKQPIVSMLEALNPTYCDCSVGAAGATVGYLCPGTSLDWMYDKLDAQFSFAFEIYEGDQGYKRGSLLQTQLQHQQQQQTSLLEAQTASHKTHARRVNTQQHQNHQHGQEHTHSHSHSCFFRDTPAVRSDDTNLLEASLTDTESLSETAARSRLTITRILYYDDLELRDRASDSVPQRAFPVPIDPRASSCAHLFNPPTPSLYHDTVDNWSRLILDLINLVHEYKVALRHKQTTTQQ